MATRLEFLPYAAEFPAANFPQLLLTNRRPGLAFDAATVETVYFTGIAPVGLTGAISIIVHYIMASATSGNVYFEAALEAITPGDAHDLDAGDYFDSVNSGNGAVPATAGYEQAITVTMTNADSIAAGDLFRLKLNRDADNGSDDAVGDCIVLGVEFRDGA